MNGWEIKGLLYQCNARTNEEYKAAKVYEPVVKDFPEVESVMNDETRHGDLVLSLLED